METSRDVVGVFGARVGEAEARAAEEAVLSAWMGLGPQVQCFEQRFTERMGQDFLMTNSGTSALQLAVAALDLPAGSEVVVPTLTWVGCAQAVLLNGLRPVFADVDSATCNVTAETVSAAVTERTRAVMVVHYAGKPVRVPEIEAFGLPIVEDAAHAVDSELGGRRCGTLGTIGMFSFDSTKNLATPDAGGVCCADAGVMKRALELRNCGVGPSGFARAETKQARWWQHGVVAAFPRLTPNDVAAAIGLAQLDRLPEGQARRAELWQRYQEGLGDLDWLQLPQGPAADERHSYFTYLVRLHGRDRDLLAHTLFSEGIYSTLRYEPLHRAPLFGQQHPERFPVAEAMAEDALNLPLHPRLSDGEVDLVIETLRAF